MSMGIVGSRSGNPGTDNIRFSFIGTKGERFTRIFQVKRYPPRRIKTIYPNLRIKYFYCVSLE